MQETLKEIMLARLWLDSVLPGVLHDRALLVLSVFSTPRLSITYQSVPSAIELPTCMHMRMCTYMCTYTQHSEARAGMLELIQVDD